MFDDNEKQAITRVMERGILSGYKGNGGEDFFGGNEVKALEREWSEHFKVKHAIAVNSATSGLWAACNAIGLKEHLTDIWEGSYGYADSYYYDEIIVSPYSMTCSASMPLLFKAKPVFADIEEDYYCLDPKSIEERITERTKAIIVVDLFGQCYDRNVINEIAERKGKEYGHNIYVIEDAAQAVGAMYKDKYAGTLGDIGVFSLNVHKPINCGEGGIVVTDDDELAMKIRLSMNHAEAVNNDLKNDNYNLLVGMNLRMTELQAAIAREQLKKLDGIVEEAQDYSKFFDDVKVRPGCTHAFYRYVWECNEHNDLSILRNIFNFKKHYINPIYKMPLFKALGYQDGLCPMCEKINRDIMLVWLKNRS